ncbi:MAG: EsaB/YukD family protein [Methanobacteriota archaeon]
MSLRIKVRNAETGASVDMELESDNSVDEIIESAASYWEKSAGAYVVRRGKSILRGNAGLAVAGIRDGDVLELIPDPEGGRRLRREAGRR